MRAVPLIDRRRGRGRPASSGQGRDWTADELAALDRLAGRVVTREIARVLDRSIESVKHQARRRGLRLERKRRV